MRGGLGDAAIESQANQKVRKVTSDPNVRRNDRVTKSRSVEDHFIPKPSPHWVRLILGHGEIERGEDTLRFVLEPASTERISDAQIHDYAGPRSRCFQWYPPLTMLVRARFSHPAPAFAGTAGFGFWNNPFTLDGEVIAPPNNAWFFYASPPSAMELVPDVPGWGWKAAVLDGGNLPGPAMKLAQVLLRLPLLVRPLARLARTRIRAAEALLPHELTSWHTYELHWRKKDCTFLVDGEQVLTTPCTPTPPLGFVAWADNQYAVAHPDGGFDFGRVAVLQRQWLELDLVVIQAP